MLNRDFSDMLSCLSVEGVEFLVVGAYALAAHGFVRSTGDIDIWIRPDAENARRCARALLRFGAPAGSFTEADLADPDSVIQLGVEPNRIDILGGIDAVAFAEAWPGRVMSTYGDLSVPVIAKQDLLRNKLATGRDKDAGDVAWLRRNIG